MDVDSNPGRVTDHTFEPRGAWYTLCGAKVPVVINGQPIGVERPCGLGEAAHLLTDSPGELAQTYRCPDCVQTNAVACIHERS